MKKIMNLMAACAAMMVSACGSTSEPEGIQVGVQLYSVRGDMEADFYGTLSNIAAMGYDGVEFAGLFDNTPEEVKAWCEELGLSPISAHVPLVDMIEDIDKVIETYSAIGCKYLVVPYVTEERRPGGEKFYETVDAIREIAQKVKAAGMTLLYHNHDFEFTKLEDGTYGLDYIYSNISADLLQTELDECWVKYAGEDPVAYLDKYAGRAEVVHFKDFFAEGAKDGDPYALIGMEEEKKESKTVFEFRPLGCGLQDMPALLEAAKQAGSKWIIIEQDNPSMGITPMQSVKKSIEYLRGIM